MNKFWYLKGLFSIGFGIIASYSFANWYVCKEATANPISYEILETQIHRGGRGEYYDMLILFQNRREVISITKEEYSSIKANNYPVVYYAEDIDKTFTDWTMKRSFRLTWLFGILAIVSAIPWKVLWFSIIKLFSTHQRD